MKHKTIKKYKLLSVALIVLMSGMNVKVLAHDLEAANSNGVTIYYKWTDNTHSALCVTYQGNTTGDGSDLSLQMEGDERYAAFQFDLWLPSDMDLMQLSLNDMRRQGHQLLYNKVGDGHYRVVALSTSANAFNGTSGQLLGITLDNFANDGVYMDNIHFVTTDGIDVPYEPISVGNATIIRSTETTLYDDQPVYNLKGQRLNNPQKGLNIVGGKKKVVK